MSEIFFLKPIGFIKSCYPEKFGVPRQSGLVKSTISELEIKPEWQPEFALQGLGDFSHVWLTFIFHLNTNQTYHAKVHPPRLGGGSMGVFATRSPHRPNPIGLSLCEVIEVQKTKIILTGVDLVDQTPVLDIKPYLPQFESVPLARGGWSTDEENRVRQIKVTWSDQAEYQIQIWQQQFTEQHRSSELYKNVNLKVSIDEIIQQDPRPLVYRGFEGKTGSPYRQQHAFRIYNGDIKFEFISENEAVVLEIDF